MNDNFRYDAPPKLSPLITGELWELADDWRVTVRGHEYVIPKGFITDGASIPRVLWRVCGHPMSTRRLPIAIFHDWAYDVECPFDIPRATADEIYRDGLVNPLGFPGWKANLEYTMLRLCGGSHYRKEQK